MRDVGENTPKTGKYCKRVPDVLILGVKKCGTMTLGRQLLSDQ